MLSIQSKHLKFIQVYELIIADWNFKVSCMMKYLSKMWELNKIYVKWIACFNKKQTQTQIYQNWLQKNRRMESQKLSTTRLSFETL